MLSTVILLGAAFAAAAGLSSFAIKEESFIKDEISQ